MIPGIAIGGKAGVGKTTVGNLIVEFAPVWCKCYALADMIKQLDMELFEPVDGKPRWRYQKLGQSLREIDPFVWIRLLDNRTSAYPGITPVIHDLRQSNEFSHYTKRGYATIRVDAPYSERIKRMTIRDGTVDVNTLHHETETQLDDVDHDYYILNDGDEESLRKQVRDIVTQIWR